MAENKLYEVTIIWGSSPEDYPENTPTTYSFETEEELDSFMYGVTEAEGWMDYATIGPDCDHETWPPKNGA